jgi:hypothetical protein
VEIDQAHSISMRNGRLALSGICWRQVHLLSLGPFALNGPLTQGSTSTLGRALGGEGLNPRVLGCGSAGAQRRDTPLVTKTAKARSFIPSVMCVIPRKISPHSSPDLNLKFSSRILHASSSSQRRSLLLLTTPVAVNFDQPFFQPFPLLIVMSQTERLLPSLL